MPLLELIEANKSYEEIKNYIEHRLTEINDDSGKCNWTALGVACTNDNIAIIELLIAKGANVKKGFAYASPLLLISYNNKLSQYNKITVINKLLDRGADINEGTAHGLIVYRDATPIKKFYENTTALDIAALSQEKQVFTHLLKHGANPEKALYTNLIKQLMSVTTKASLVLFGMVKDPSLGNSNSILANFHKKSDVFFHRFFLQVIKEHMNVDIEAERNNINNELNCLLLKKTS